MEAYHYPSHGGTCFVMTPSWLATKYCPFIIESFLDRNVYKNFGMSVTDFIKIWLDLKNYIYLVVDAASFTASKKESYFPHDIFISGYDDEKEVFFVHDFLFDLRFSCVEIPYEEFEKAFHNLLPENDYINEANGGITLWRFNEKGEYSFNFKLVKKEIKNYYHSVNVHIRENFARNEVSESHKESKYGISVYEFLSHELKMKKRYCISLFHDFYEHKLLMVERLSYINEMLHNANLSEFIKTYSQLKDNMYACSMLMIRYDVTQNDSCFDKALKILKTSEKLEKEVLGRLIEVLDQFD